MRGYGGGIHHFSGGGVVGLILSSCTSYGAVAIVNASGTGYMAYVRFADGRVFEITGGWYGHLRLSAWVEPIGGLQIVEWL